ncbi:MAG: RNA methyltransferase [Paludibacteraceae bacterium]|nr:RNA methyltransferase [Paludibacteraceae bacterium]
MKETFPIMGKTYKGLEDVLAKELQDMGAQEIEVGNRAVSFKGDKALLYKVNLCARTATRFIVPLVTFEARDADELYAKAKAIDWSEYLDADNTFSIDSTVYSETFTHSKFVAYRVKDAIADQFMEKDGKRPSVSLTNADLMINVHVSETVCTISLDSTGESLHKRGYRVGQTEAPISEVLAAGMLLQAGWDGSTDFIDPMCGSGTIVIEAALIALNIPPGIFRKEFAFEKWRDFDKELFDDLYNDDSFEREFNHKIYGSDISVPAIRIAEQNVKSAGLTKYIELNAVSIQDIEMPETAKLMVTNPPYGERLKPEKIQDLYGDIGRMLKQKFTGGTAWVISSEESYLSCIGMKPSQKIHLMNSEMDCLFCQYEVFAGKREDFVKEKIRNGEYHKEEPKPEFKRTERGHFSFEKETRSFDDFKRERNDFRERREPRQHTGRRFYSDRPEDRNYGENRGRRDDEGARPRRSREGFSRDDRDFRKESRFDRDRKPFGRFRDSEEGSSRGFRKDFKKDFRRDDDRKGRDRDDRRRFRDDDKRDFKSSRGRGSKPFGKKDSFGGRGKRDGFKKRNEGRRKDSWGDEED